MATYEIYESDIDTIVECFADSMCGESNFSWENNVDMLAMREAIHEVLTEIANQCKQAGREESKKRIAELEAEKTVLKSKIERIRELKTDDTSMHDSDCCCVNCSIDRIIGAE